MNRNSIIRFSILAILILSFECAINAQVTVGANSVPKATLDVVASDPANASVAEGVIAPRLTGDQIKAKDAAYTANQTGAIVYATAAVGTPSTKTANITDAGYYNFDGAVWQKLGGKPTTRVIRQNVSTTYSPAASEFWADKTIIIAYGPGGCPAMSLPNLTLSETGKEVIIHNALASLNFATNYTRVSSTDGLGSTPVPATNSNINNTNSVSYIWAGTHWVVMAR